MCDEQILTGYKLNSSGSGGGAIREVLTDFRGLLFFLVVYTLCDASALQSVKPQRSLGDAAVQHITL